MRHWTWDTFAATQKDVMGFQLYINSTDCSHLFQKDFCNGGIATLMDLEGLCVHHSLTRVYGYNFISFLLSIKYFTYFQAGL